MGVKRIKSLIIKKIPFVILFSLQMMDDSSDGIFKMLMCKILKYQNKVLIKTL